MQIVNPDEGQLAQIFDELADIYDLAYAEGPQQPYRSEYETHQYLRWLRHGDPAGFFVALDDGRPVGFASVHGGWQERGGRVVAELHEVVVRPEWRGRDIGAALVTRAVEYAHQQGRDALTLWVGVNNTPAAALYRKMGFRHLLQRGVWVRMEKPLTSER